MDNGIVEGELSTSRLGSHLMETSVILPSAKKRRTITTSRLLNLNSRDCTQIEDVGEWRVVSR